MKLKMMIITVILLLSFSACSLFDNFNAVSFAGATAVVSGEGFEMFDGNSITSLIITEVMSKTKDCSGGGTLERKLDTDAKTYDQIFTNCKFKDVELGNCSGKTDITIDGTLNIPNLSDTEYQIQGTVKITTNGNEKECKVDLIINTSGEVEGTACGEEIDEDSISGTSKEDYCSVFGLDPEA